MPASFFGAAELPQVKRIPAEPQCGKCGLYQTGCQSPKMPPSGNGRRNILILAEAPGAEEDARGVQLVGASGRELRDRLAKFGIDMRRDCILDNALACRPPNNEIPNAKVVDFCRPHVINTIREEKPEVIIPLGAIAIDSLMPWLWKDEDPGGVGRWAGFRIPDQKLNAWVCPTFHPAHILRVKDKDPMIDRLFDRHLEAIAELKGRPWDRVPDYTKEVEVIKSPLLAAKWLASNVHNYDAIAFDFETTTLKPDGPHARIVCVSVCVNGKRTAAFPWVGPVVSDMQMTLENPRVKKVGWNVKFETRWARRYGIRVRGWKMDGQLAAHAVYNGGKGRAITGLDFQAYVHLGVGKFNSKEMTEKLKATRSGGGNEPNRITDIDLDSLLLYCGIDSLEEYRVCVALKKEIVRGAR